MSSPWTICFTVPYTPISKGNVSAVRTRRGMRVIYGKSVAERDRLKSFNAAVTIRAIEASRVLGGRPWPYAINAHVAFHFPAPKAKQTFYTAQGEMRRAAGHGDVHTKKPDVDKIQRALFDALMGIVYVDDCQISDVSVCKRWTDAPIGLISVTITPVISQRTSGIPF